MLTVNVSSILAEPGLRMPVSISEKIPTVRYGGEEIPFIGNVDFSGVLVSPDGKSVIAGGEVSALLDMKCVRCLKPLRIPFSVQTEEVYTREETAQYPDALRFDGDQVDLTELIESAIILSAPVYSVCKEDCKGLCPKCGADLNEGDCSCEKEPIKSGNPFASLKNLLDPDEEV